LAFYQKQKEANEVDKSPKLQIWPRKSQTRNPGTVDFFTRVMCIITEQAKASVINAVRTKTSLV